MSAPMRNLFCKFGQRFGQDLLSLRYKPNLTASNVQWHIQRTLWTSRYVPKQFSLKKFTFLTAGFGLAAYSVDIWRRAQGSGIVFADGGAPPNYTPTRRVRCDTDTTGLKLTLFQYQTCPFCCKVRAYLDYHGFSYDVIEVNSVWRTQTKWSKYKKVPILVCRGMGEDGFLQINDSSVIISALETFLVDKTQPLDKIVTFYPSMESTNNRGKKVLEYPNKYFVMFMDKDIASTPEQRKRERNWRSWVDDVFVHVISPNIYRTPRESLEAFKYFSEVGDWEKVFSTPERYVVIYVGAIAMYFVGKLLKRRHHLKEDVRQSLYDACQKWSKVAKKHGSFVGGSEPNLADLSMYGTMSSFEGCVAFQDLLRNSDIKTWYYNMKEKVAVRGGQYKTNGDN